MVVVGGKACSRRDKTSGTADVETRDKIFCFPFFPAASRSLRWMRRVSSFCRSGLTQVYSPVISRSLWPAIFDASIALPPTS
jgi:hypothetical protein